MDCREREVAIARRITRRIKSKKFSSSRSLRVFALSRSLSSAFTLVEVLVVIGIIALLVSILLPALSNARQQAKAVQCLSNLRQLGLAAIRYTDIFDTYYPMSHYGLSNEWDFNVTSTGVQPGILWQGQTNSAVLQCPSYEGKSATSTDLYTGYNYNTSFIGHGDPKPGGGLYPPAKVSQIHHPDATALFGDGEYGFPSETDKYMRAPIQETPVTSGDKVSDQTRLAGTQGYRHRGKTNVCYCDGHAASVGTRVLVSDYMITGSNGQIVYPPNPTNGFLSADNSAYDGR